jgi:TonB family protein
VASRRVCVIAACMMMMATAAATPSVPKQPTGKWLVEYGKDQCLLSRNYGTEAKPLILTFERLPMTSKVSVYVLKTGDNRDMVRGQAAVSAGAAEANDIRYAAYSTQDRKLRVITLDMDAKLLEAAEQSGAIHIGVRREVDESFAVPRIQLAVQALDDCVLDLGRLWGFPVEKQKQMRQAAEPVTPLMKLFDGNDYPRKAIWNEEMGRAKAVLYIDATGTPTNCSLTRSTGSKSLDETTCALLMKRARFHPAIDKDGQPMPTLDATNVVWLISD